MADPAISTITAQHEYTATSTKSLFGDLTVPLTSLGTQREFSVTYPTAAADVQVTIAKGATSLALLPGAAAPTGLSDGATFAGRQIDASTGPGGAGQTVLTCTFSVLSGPATDAWTVRVTSATPHDYAIATPNCTITRLMCDPIAKFTVSSTPSLATPNHVPEKSSVLLTAANAGAASGQTVVGAPLPGVLYRFVHTGGDVAITGLPVCGASTTVPFTAPGVYGNKTADITLDVWFDGACPSTPGPLFNTSAPVTVTVEPRAQRLVLALDRSGSMGIGGRWDKATTAARIFVNLFAALRDGVHPQDRVGIVVFEDSQCKFHGAPIDPLVAPVLALSTPDAADGAICGLALGSPGSCTPIGDALVRAQSILGVDTQVRRTIILLTDGYENSGTTRVDPSTPTGSGSTPSPYAQPADIPIFAIGFGPTVQEDVLDHIALPTGTGPAAIYRHVTDVGQLQEAIGQMVALSQGGKATTILGAAPASPFPDANARYLHVTAGASRLAVAVEWTTPAPRTIELHWRVTGTSVAFTPQLVSVRDCPKHGFVSVDIEAVVPVDPATGLTPATEWAVVYKAGAALASVAIPGGDVLAVEDLYADADITFDKNRYSTGDEMVVTARLRAGPEPIRDARVFVELARPGESLGTFLATNAPDYRPQPHRGPDPPHPKQAMLQTLLGHTQQTGLPIVQPKGIFTDNTDELWDDGDHRDDDPGDGNFANVYADTDKEGSYTFRFLIEGLLPDGSPIRRLTTISRWVGVGVDPLASPMSVQTGLQGSAAGLLAALVTIKPGDRMGNLLGPFRTADIQFVVKGGTVAGDLEDHLDGTYAQRIEYRRGGLPVVTAVVNGTPSTPLPVGHGICGWVALKLRALLEWWLRRCRRKSSR
jgi:hypothetical protein